MAPSIPESDFSNLDTQTIHLLERLKRLNGEIFNNRESDTEHRSERNNAADSVVGHSTSKHRLSSSFHTSSPPLPHPEPQRPASYRDESSDDDEVLVIDSTTPTDEESGTPARLHAPLDGAGASSRRRSPLLTTPPSPALPITTSDVTPASAERLQNYHQMKNLFSAKMKSPPKELIALHREALQRIEVLQQENQELHQNIDHMEQDLLNSNDAHIRESRRLNQSLQEYREALQQKEQQFEEREQQLLQENRDRDERIQDLETKLLHLQQRLTKQATADNSGRTSESILREKDNIIASLNDQVQKLNEALLEARTQKHETESALNRSDANLKMLKSKVNALTDEMDNLRQRNDTMREELDRTRAEAHERTQHHDNATQRLRKRIESQERTIQNLTTELQSTQVSLAEVDSDAKEVERLQRDYEQLTKDFEQYKSQVEDRELASGTVEKSLEHSREMLRDKDATLADLQAQVHELKHDKLRIEMQFQKYRERNEELQGETLTIHNKIQHMKNSYLQMVAQRDSLQERLDQLLGSGVASSGSISPRLSGLTNVAQEERIKSLENLLEETTNKLSTSKRDLAQLQQDYVQLEAKYKSAHTMHIEMSTEKSKNSEYKSSLLRYQEQYEVLYVQYTALENKHIDLEREFEEYRQNEHSATEFGEELKKQNEALQRELVELRSLKHSEIDEQMRKEQLDSVRLDTVHERLTQLTQELSQVQLEKQELQSKITTLEIEKQVRLDREEKREKEATSQVEYLNDRIKQLKQLQDRMREEHAKALRQLNDEKLQLENDLRRARHFSHTENRTLVDKEIESSKAQVNALRVKYETEVSNLRRQLSENATLIESLKHDLTSLNRSRHEELADMRVQMRLMENSNRYQDMYAELNAKRKPLATTMTGTGFQADLHKRGLSTEPVKRRQRIHSSPSVLLSNGGTRSHVSLVTSKSPFSRNVTWRDQSSILNQTM